MIRLERLSQVPILTPTENWWESTNVFNPGATVFQDKIILLYRAKGNDYISRFGLAISSDGINFERFPEPVFEGQAVNPYERLGVEDPRITQIDGEYFIYYTGASVYPLDQVEESQAASLSKKAPWRIRTFLTKTKDFKTFTHEKIELHFDSKDSTLFPEKIKGKYRLLHRIYPDVYLTESEDLASWKASKKIISPRSGYWDSERVGAGAPPLKTRLGWLHFYHGVDDNHVYHLGLLLHKIDEPERILYRSELPILSPEMPWEKQGYVDNVVFSCGAVEKNGQYLIYYGAADKVIALAAIEKEKLLAELEREVSS